MTNRRSQILKNTQFYFITELFSSCNTRNILLAAAVLPYTDSVEVQTNVCFLQTYGWCYEYCVHVKQTLKQNKTSEGHKKNAKKI